MDWLLHAERNSWEWGELILPVTPSLIFSSGYQPAYSLLSLPKVCLLPLA